MAKITRVAQRIFGSGAGVDQIAQFGSLFAGTPAFTTSAAVAQSLSNWLTGWFAAAIGGNAPAIEDMNAAMFVMTYQLAYILQTGSPEWNTDTVYYIGSIANDGSGVLYKSLTNANQGNALSDTANWRKLSSSVPVALKTANYVVTPNDSFISINCAGGTVALDLPLSTDVPGQILYVKKTDSSTNPINVIAAGADAIDGLTIFPILDQNEAYMFISDGAGSWNIF